MIGNRDKYWGGSENQPALKLRWRQATNSLFQRRFQLAETHDRRRWTAVYVVIALSLTRLFITTTQMTSLAVVSRPPSLRWLFPAWIRISCIRIAVYSLQDMQSTLQKNKYNDKSQNKYFDLKTYFHFDASPCRLKRWTEGLLDAVVKLSLLLTGLVWYIAGFHCSLQPRGRPRVHWSQTRGSFF